MCHLLYREKTAFMETSLFERAGKHIANGAWLYKEVIDLFNLELH